MEILADVGICRFPASVISFRLGVESGPDFCRFPGWTPTEAELTPGEPRLPLSLDASSLRTPSPWNRNVRNGTAQPFIALTDQKKGISKC